MSETVLRGTTTGRNEPTDSTARPLADANPLLVHRALALVHQFAKDAAWMRRLALRIGESSQAKQSCADAESIVGLSTRVMESSQQLLRAAAGATPRGECVVALDEVIEASRTVCQRMHPEADLVCSIEATVASLLVAEEIEPVLVCVLDNALRASRVSDPVEIAVASESAGQVQIRLRDRGRGMDREVLAHCFEAGFTTRGDQGGSGVGLTLVRETLQWLGGSIAIESVLGEGTVVEIHVPCRVPPVSPVGPREARALKG